MKKGRTFSADLLTPITAFHALKQKGSALLETAENQEGNRYSLLGIEPIATLRARGRKISIEQGSGVREEEGDPFQILAALEKELAVPGIGFISYDAVRSLEKIPDAHPSLEIPDFFFRFYGSMLFFDHQTAKMTIHAMTDEEIEGIMGRLQETGTLSLLRENKEPVEVISDLSDEEFCEKIKLAKKHLVNGDVFQIVLSRTFQVKTNQDPFQIYRALRQKSPAPYSFFLEGDDVSLAGASPEKLISVEEGLVESMPIAGTRTLDHSEKELLQDPKENAEHVMLVDLARNDLGRICEPGSVVVQEFKKIEKFSHVMHMISRVTGRLKPKLHALDALKASFPAGTLTGAPKVRAMELIDGLEVSKRGAYGGAVLFLDGKGNLKSCIAIRMAVIRKGNVFVRAGAGIVLDSDPQKEAEETRAKAKAVLDALTLIGGKS